MSRLATLYQEMILEHNRKPRNFKVIDPCTCQSHGVNPLCGDDYYLYVTIKDQKIEDIGFNGSGCAISKSSGSLMTNNVKGLSIEEASQKKDQFLKLLLKEPDETEKKELGNLRIFEGVKQFPIRVKCATLIWRALEDILNKESIGKISTE